MTSQDIERDKSSIAAKEAHTREGELEEKKKTGKVQRWAMGGKGLRDYAGSIAEIGKGMKLFNHPSWYTDYPDAEYTARLGIKSYYGEKLGDDAIDTVIPEIAIVHWLPAINRDRDGNNYHTTPGVQGPADVALLHAQELVRQVNAGAKNYEPSDIGIISYAVNEILAAMGEMYRDLALLSDYDPSSAMTREGIYCALHGCSKQAFVVDRTNAFKLREAFNAAVTTLRNAPIPHMALFDRTWHLTSNIFRDEDLKHSNLYAYKRMSFGLFRDSSELQNLPAKRLEFFSGWLDNDWDASLDNRIANLQTMCARLSECTDFITIMGDVAKAFGFVELLHPLDEYPTISPIIDPVTLTQLDNTTLVGAPIIQKTGANSNQRFSFYDIWDVSGHIVQGTPNNPSITVQADMADFIKPVFTGFYGSNLASKASAINAADMRVIDAPKDDISSDDAYVLTRNLASFKCVAGSSAALTDNIGVYNESGGTWTLGTGNLGSEYRQTSNSGSGGFGNTAYDDNPVPSLVSARVIVPQTHGTEFFCYVTVHDDTGYNAGNIASYIYAANLTTIPMLRGFTSFAHMPPIVISTSTAVISGFTVRNNVTTVSDSQLKSLNNAAVYSLNYFRKEGSLKSGGSAGAPRKKGKFRK